MQSDDLCGVSMYAQWVEGERPDVVVLPRQHLGEPTTWRRLDATRALTRVPRGGSGRQRLAWVVSRLGPRVRWEGADDADRVLTARVGGGESPVLGVVGAPPGASDDDAVAWVASRVAGVSGKGARAVGGAVLVAAGRRLAAAGVARGVAPWRAAIALNPEQVSAYTNLGVAAAREGRLDLAITLTRRALELDPERARAWRNLADFLSARGDREGADEARREATRRQ
ncbi:MAG: tetratricopeptide repeat protein [Polyangiales bacterium]